jgi:MerR family mercuric resistance operon transcriptional regulator
VAAAANVSGETLRYYEREGLLAAPLRAPNGYRDYPAETVAVVRFIKRAQELGFSLEDARQLLELRAAPASNRLRARALVQSKLLDIDRKLADLHALRRALDQLVENCCQGSEDRCPILEALDGSAPVRRLTTRELKGSTP